MNLNEYLGAPKSRGCWPSFCSSHSHSCSWSSFHTMWFLILHLHIHSFLHWPQLSNCLIVFQNYHQFWLFHLPSPPLLDTSVGPDTPCSSGSRRAAGGYTAEGQAGIIPVSRYSRWRGQLLVVFIIFDMTDSSIFSSSLHSPWELRP